jgi:hypothetical protein
MTLNRNRKDGKDVEFARRREKDKRGDGAKRHAGVGSDPFGVLFALAAFVVYGPGFTGKAA